MAKFTIFKSSRLPHHINRNRLTVGFIKRCRSSLVFIELRCLELYHLILLFDWFFGKTNEHTKPSLKYTTLTKSNCVLVVIESWYSDSSIRFSVAFATNSFTCSWHCSRSFAKSRYSIFSFNNSFVESLQSKNDLIDILNKSPYSVQV